jgi:hypothetical protein
MNDFPDLAPSRALWLITLADLALLLVGFLVLIQATAAPRRDALAQGLREAFGATEPAPMPVSATSARFAPGAAALTNHSALVAWAVAATRDPRVTLTITGATDGTRADTDAATGSAALLAADRARVVAAVLAPSITADRLTLVTSPRASGRTATVTLAFAGERP